MDVETIGKVCGIRNEREIEWTFQDFSTLSVEGDKYYHSPSFYFANQSWYLRIYPNGAKEDTSIGHVGVYLFRKSSGPPIKLECSLILKTMDEKTDRERDISSVFKYAGFGFGRPQFLKRSEFLESKSKLELPDVFTVTCKMKFLESTDDATSEKLPEDFKALMLSGDFSDTVIKVKEEEFPLHRAILTARNPYFQCMFKNDMIEKKTGIVSIEDCEPDIFRTFIHFIYTGKVDNLVVKNVRELYEVSDKYQDDLLKNECLEFMMKTLSEDTFCDYIIFALKYDKKKLLEKATELFTSKPNKIVCSAKWQNFVENYPIQANELFVKVVNRHVK